MDAKELIRGRKLLIVDDEEDVLEELIDLLDMCKIDTATSFEDGKTRLEEGQYDVAILDIMGVNGFKLLEIAKKQKVPALMLTAHSLTEESLKRSAQDGAAYFAPKEEMQDIHLFVADVIEASDKKMNSWEKWFDRFASFYDRRFHGTHWREQEKKFWDKMVSSAT
jgi:DNA-binding NtrC family response regulator